MTSSFAEPAETRDFFLALKTGWAMAIRAEPEIRCRHFHLGSSVLEIQFATPRLETLLSKALAHLACSPRQEPDLRIHVWDSEKTGHIPPAPHWDAAGLTRGEITSVSSEGWRVSLFDNVLHAYESEKKTGYVWCPLLENPSSALLAAPFLPLFHWWSLEKGLALLHAAGMGNSKGGLLLAGKGGSGKSTTAMACLGSQLKYLADDYCLIDPIQRQAYSLYSSGKLDANSRGLLPNLARFPLARSGANQKEVLFVAEHLPGNVVNQFPIKGIVLPRIDPAQPLSITAASGIEAITALAPSSVFQLSFAGPALLSQTARLARNVPAFRLNLTPQTERIPGELDQLLERLGE
jgi:hypothetical protein